MVRRFRFVRILKWAGALTCLLILAAFVLSLWWLVQCSGDRIIAVLDSGELYVMYDFQARPDITWGDDFYVERHAFEYSPRFIGNVYGAWSSQLVFPLWLPLLLALAPTLLLWFFDRRVPPGHCHKCRYNLTGNTTGHCPECGANLATSNSCRTHVEQCETSPNAPTPGLD